MATTPIATAGEKKCGTCANWCKIGTSVMHRTIMEDDRAQIVPPGNIGYCRAGRPAADFKWPRTHEGQVCGEWRVRKF